MTWTTFCADLDRRIAEIRRAEGFDGRCVPWQTFGPLPREVIVANARRQRAAEIAARAREAKRLARWRARQAGSGAA